MPGISTTDFPGFAKATYADVLARFEATKPWRSKYNPHNERPIGARAIKTNDGYKPNKAMRQLDDGSIAFRLFDTDCVIWHPDGTLTIEGYPSMSTNAFIGCLTPEGISHGFRGRRDPEDPVLHLMPVVRHKRSWGDFDGPDWRSGEIVRCDRPVKLHYNAAQKRWVPSEPDALQAFHVPTIDRRHAREASRMYNLPTLSKVINAVTALAAPAVIPQAGQFGMSAIMELLQAEDYVGAISIMPRGQTKGFGGRWLGSTNGVRPGFLRELRDHIYDHEGVITWVEKHSLSPAAYKRYIRDTNRFDA